MDKLIYDFCDSIKQKYCYTLDPNRILYRKLRVLIIAEDVSRLIHNVISRRISERLFHKIIDININAVYVFSGKKDFSSELIESTPINSLVLRIDNSCNIKQLEYVRDTAEEIYGDILYMLENLYIDISRFKPVKKSYFLESVI